VVDEDTLADLAEIDLLVRNQVVERTYRNPKLKGSILSGVK